jgi:hypothetical protein
VSITYSECVSLFLVIQHAKRMSRIIWSSVAWPTYFSASFHKRHDYQKKLLNIKCVLIFSTTFSQTFLIARRIQHDIIVSLHWSSGNVSIIILLRY